MLTSFFGKSNPVNYLILGIFIIAAYLFGGLSGSGMELTPLSILEHIFLICVALFSIMLLDFIVQKNALTRNNTYAILFYGCFIAMIPAVFLNADVLLANFFLLLGMRRIISLKNDKNSEKKILDASLWITVASFFYFYSLLYLVPLWIAIVQKPNSNYKQMLIPFSGFFAAVIINVAYHLLVFDSFLWFFEWKDSINLHFSKYNSISLILPIAVIITILIWTGINQILRFSALSTKEKSTNLLLGYIFIASVFVALAGPEKNGSEMLFLFAPTAIVSANYLESVKMKRSGAKDVAEVWFKEMLLWLVVLLPILIWFL